MKKSMAFCLILILVMSAFSGCTLPSEGPNDASGLVICEVMSSNSSTVADCDGEYSDYIVLYNRSGKRINLAGWCLSDNNTKPTKWGLPAAYMEPGEYFVIFASGKDGVFDGEYHTNFSISVDGENIYLVSPSGAVEQELAVPALKSDVAYGLKDHTSSDEYCYYASGMPGRVNISASADSMEQLAGSGKRLVFTEYMNNNQSLIKDNYGFFSDFIEITNMGEDCSLAGLYLSDDEQNLQKWEIPGNVMLASGESVVIFTSGRDEYKDGALHASFGLSSSDKKIYLSDAVGLVASAELEYLPANLSKGVSDAQGSKWQYYPDPTPGAQNGEGYDTVADACGITAKGVWINEVSSVATKEGSYDWIEIYNGSDRDVVLDGFSITDDLAVKGYVFEDYTVKAGQYRLLYASGGEPEKHDRDSVYLPFKINNSGTDIYILTPEGTLHDAFSSGRLDEGYTSGRALDSPDRLFYDIPTPGEANAKGYPGYAKAPTLTPSGYKSIGDTVVASGSEGQVLRYTVDGSTPTEKSKQMGELTLSKTTVVKVRAFKEGKLPSATVTATYVIGQHGIPFISLSGDPDGIFGYNNGILANGPGYTESFPHSGANFWKDWERRVTFEYHTVTGQRALCLDAGIKVFGQYSRGYDQKSLAVHFRDRYGASEVTYPFFEDNLHTTLKHLVLRAGGQDQKQTRIRDAFCAQVLKKAGARVAIMDWAPVALYINGEYWGYYDLREKVNEDYLNTHYGLDASNVTIIKNDSRALEGTNTEIKALYSYVKSHDLTVKENYDYVCSVMDTDSFIDFLIAEIFFANGDTGNKKCFKENTEGSKWYWVVFDMDMTVRPEALWGDRYNTIEMLFNPAGHGSNNGFTTCLQRALIKNKDFRKRFITRYAELLNTAFTAESLNAVLDEMLERMGDEMKQDATRWSRPTYDKWQTEIGYMRNVLNRRREVAKSQLIKFCSITSAEQAELFPND